MKNEQYQLTLPDNFDLKKSKNAKSDVTIETRSLSWSQTAFMKRFYFLLFVLNVPMVNISE